MHAVMHTLRHPSVFGFSIVATCLFALFSPLSAEAGTFYVTASSARTVDQIAEDGTPLPNLISYPSGTNTTGIAVNSVGTILVASSVNNSIYSVTPGGISTLYASGLPNNLAGMAFDSSDRLFVTTTDSTTPIGVVSSLGVYTALDIPDFTSYSATNLVFDASGNLYVANTYDYAPAYNPHSVVKLTPTGAPEDPWTPSVFYDFAVGYQPGGMAFDDIGNLYVASFATNTISKILPGGTLDGTFVLSGTALSNPYGMTFANGNLYSVDFGGTRVMEITLGGVASVFSTLTETPSFIAYSAIPEPTSAALILAGVVGLIATSSRRRLGRIGV
jgi:streptogramin lyase